MSSFIYSVGINNVGSYQVSGRPFCATGSLNNSGRTLEFPDVTKQIIVLNRDSGADTMDVYFHVDSPSANRYTINAGEQQTFNVKCATVYLSSSAIVDYTLYASLTGIPKQRMYALTGSGITS